MQHNYDIIYDASEANLPESKTLLTTKDIPSNIIVTREQYRYQ